MALSSFANGWFDVRFLGKDFKFPECASGNSHICCPMPDESELAKMYDSSYLETGGDGSENFAQEKLDEAVNFLKTKSPGRFIDYGCGSGSVLKAAKVLGWDVLGIDFNPEFSAELREMGIEVLGHRDPVPFKADVLHLGDVLEHLTEMDSQFPKILDLVKDGGLLIAQGPLEANPNFFYSLLKLGKSLRGNRVTEMPPYHVILATSEGQRALFRRFGLEEQVFSVTEVAWPAPERFSLAGGIRSAGLFSVRKVSQFLSRRDLEGLGNRYFYAGRKVP